jgi:hypothetical protein
VELTISPLMPKGFNFSLGRINPKIFPEKPSQIFEIF